MRTVVSVSQIPQQVPEGLNFAMHISHDINRTIEQRLNQSFRHTVSTEVTAGQSVKAVWCVNCIPQPVMLMHATTGYQCPNLFQSQAGSGRLSAVLSDSSDTQPTEQVRCASERTPSGHVPFLRRTQRRIYYRRRSLSVSVVTARSTRAAIGLIARIRTTVRPESSYDSEVGSVTGFLPVIVRDIFPLDGALCRSVHRSKGD